jgi:RND family efflux transporter MFP subunit
VRLADAATAAELAEIEVRSAEVALARRTVTAPFAGVTGLTDLSVGDLVASSAAITTLDDLSTVRVGFEVPERWASRIALGQSISATVQALPGVPFAGTISAVDNRVDETARTLRVEAALANEGRSLKAGMAVTVQLEFETDAQLVVPSASVQWDRTGSYVWKVVDSAARRVDTTIVRRQTGVISLTGDIAAGDRVVVEGIQGLREGALVAEVNQTPTIVDDTEGPAVAADGEMPPVLGGAPAAETRS